MPNPVDLHHTHSGQNNPTILLLHGLNESLEGYRATFHFLHNHLHVFAIDLRGHGRSPQVGPYRIRDYQADVTHFIETRIGDSVFLAGHSLGGLVASAVASKRPDLVEGLILEDPPLFTAQTPTIRNTPFFPLFVQIRTLLLDHHQNEGTAADMEARVSRWPAGSEKDTSANMLAVFGKEFVSRLALELHQTDPQTLDPVLDGSLFEGFVPEEALPRITCSTLLMAGSYAHGGAMRPEDVEKTVSLIPTCTLKQWDQFGHDIHTMAPAEYSQEIIHFVKTIRPLA